MVKKFLIFAFFLLLNATYCFSSVSHLQQEIIKEFTSFNEDSKVGTGKAVQFIEHLLKQSLEVLDRTMQQRIGRKIALVIGTGEGVGGISVHQANPKEEAVIKNAIIYLVQFLGAKEDWFSLSSSRTPHQGTVANLVAEARKFQEEVEQTNARIQIRNTRMNHGGGKGHRHGGGRGHHGPREPWPLISTPWK